jgi:hypothetical protein
VDPRNDSCLCPNSPSLPYLKDVILGMCRHFSPVLCACPLLPLLCYVYYPPPCGSGHTHAWRVLVLGYAAGEQAKPRRPSARWQAASAAAHALLSRRPVDLPPGGLHFPGRTTCFHSRENFP